MAMRTIDGYVLHLFWIGDFAVAVWAILLEVHFYPDGCTLNDTERIGRIGTHMVGQLIEYYSGIKFCLLS